MGILKAVAGAIGGGLADSWLEVVEPDNMTATTVCTRGVQVSNKRSSNKKGNENIISNGSVIHVGVNQMMQSRAITRFICPPPPPCSTGS